MSSTPQPPLILVIDDDDAIRATLLDMLELNGYRTVSATNGRDGLALAQRDVPALIVSDIAMPGMTGFELLRALRANPALRSIPVIVVSAKVERAATREGMELGADDFITKPFTEDEVIHSIRTRLEKKELLDELDAFAHTVAHDLKNPLATLTGRLDLLELTIGKADEEALRHNVREASVAAHRLTRIIEDLLVLAGVRRQEAAPVVLDMPALVAEARDRLEDLLRRTGTAVTVAPEFPAAYGYAPWVVHVWSNYLSNAAKYAGPAPRVTIGGELRPDGARARFWVRDGGPGLDAAAQAALFVPFTRISTVRATGHGLGLSIVRRIVEKLGGEVGVDSAPGQGACFWFELPVRAPAPKGPALPPPPLFLP
jgi:two-component system sensor histidine kinase/response regulator